MQRQERDVDIVRGFITDRALATAAENAAPSPIPRGRRAVSSDAAELATEPGVGSDPIAAAGSDPSAEFSTAASAEPAAAIPSSAKPAAAITSSAEPAAPEPNRARVQHVRGILRVVRTDEACERHQAELH